LGTVTVLLVLLSAFVHAVWNAILKRCRMPETAAVAMIAVGAATGWLAILVFQAPVPSGRALAWTLAAGMLEGCYVVALARALARAPLGSAYTVARGGALLVVWPISVVFLGEPLDVMRALGTALVLGGLAAIGASERGEKASGGAHRVGLVYAAVAAVFIGGFNLAYKLALASGGAPAALNAVSLTVASAVNLVMVGRRRGEVLLAARTEALAVTAGGVLATGGFILFLFAMEHAGAGAVLTLRNTSILFAQVLAIALGERPTRLGMTGAILVTAGALFLAK
jgi:drug/metabolite transporter (DMT)-like permease